MKTSPKTWAKLARAAGSPLATHGVDVTDTLAQGVESLKAHAAYLAGLATGVWSATEELTKLWRAERRFEPMMNSDECEARRTQWRRAVDRSRLWAE